MYIATIVGSLISLACTWSIPADTRNTLVVALPGLIFFGLNLVEFLLGVRMRRQVAQLTPP
jgi:hypothetical protein